MYDLPHPLMFFGGNCPSGGFVSTGWGHDFDCWVIKVSHWGCFPLTYYFGGDFDSGKLMGPDRAGLVRWRTRCFGQCGRRRPYRCRGPSSTAALFARRGSRMGVSIHGIPQNGGFPFGFTFVASMLLRKVRTWSQPAKNLCDLTRNSAYDSTGRTCSMR